MKSNNLLILLAVVSSLLHVLADDLIFSDISSSNSTDNALDPKPKPKPKPKPTPPVFSKDYVSEAKLFSRTMSLTEYQRFGHSLASYGSSVAVGTSKESLSAHVYAYNIVVSSVGKNNSEHNDVTVSYSDAAVVPVPTEKSSGSEPTYYDGFGQSVALNADVLIVAAPFRSTALASSSSDGYATGTVYSYSTDAAQAYQAAQTLVPSYSNANMRFGAALSLMQNTLAVGAPGADALGQMSGEVYIYTYDSDTSSWTESAVLRDEATGAPFAQYGSSVFLSNDANALAVGATGYSKNAVHSGVVFLYTRRVREGENDTNIRESGFTLQTTLVPADLHAYAYFGHTVHFRDAVGLVSAYDEFGSGVVYLYEQTVGPVLSGDVADFQRARAYLCTGCFLRGAAAASQVATWTLKTVLRPATASPINQFGASLAIFHTSDADYSSSPFFSPAYVVAIGAPGDVMPSASAMLTGNNVNVFAGAVYLFLGPHNFTSSSTNAVVVSDKWSLMTKVFANDSSAYDAYGQSMCLLGAHLLVGAELANSDSAHKSGAVYLETNLIPYFVAATQTQEEENVNNGGGSGENDDAGDDTETSWDAFVAFCQSSGGIVTMSFLPVAVLILACLAHSKAKGHTVIHKEYLRETCTAWQASIGAGAGAAFGYTGSKEADPMMLAKNRRDSVSPSDAEALTTVFDNSVPEGVPQDQSSVEPPSQRRRAQSLATAGLPDGTGSADTTPSLWQRMQHFARNPLFLQSAVHVPLAHSEGSTAAEAVRVGTPVVTPVSASAGNATDLRLCAPGPEDAQCDAGLSIRSPITHIPRHALQILSPHGKDPSPTIKGKGTVSSYRIVEQQPQQHRQGSVVENKPMLLSHTELAKLKQKLNAEFTAANPIASAVTAVSAARTSPSSVPLPVSGEKAPLLSVLPSVGADAAGAAGAAGKKKKSVKYDDVNTMRA